MAILATDDFNRADSVGLGANWVRGHSSTNLFDVSSAQARNITFDGDIVCRYIGVAAPNDQYAKVTLKQLLPNYGLGPAVRIHSSQHTMYYCQANTTEIAVWRVDGENYAQLGSTLPAAAVNDILELRAQGTTITLLKNGTSILSVTDSAIPAGSPGFKASCPALNVLALDDFEMGDFGAGSSVGLNVVLSEAVIGGASFG